MTSQENGDVFIVKLDSLGDFVWGGALHGTLTGDSTGVTVASNGDVYLGGYFNGTTDFDPGAGTFELTSVDGNNGYIAKLDASGDFIWAGHLPRASLEGFTLGSNDSIYYTGLINDGADLDPGAGTSIFSATGNDAYVAKVDADGVLDWARATGGSSNDGGIAVAVSSQGDVYVTGVFADTADFDPGGGIFELTSEGHNDVFLMHLDAQGDFVWAGAVGGTNYDYGSDVVVGPDGSVYMAGSFAQTVDFDPGDGEFLLTADGTVFVLKLDPAGNFDWAQQLGQLDPTPCWAMALNNDGSVYTAGAYGFVKHLPPGAGGGVFNAGSVTVTNSTVSGNDGDMQGGGLFNAEGAQATVVSATVTDNSALRGGGLFNASGGALTAAGTIVAANTASGSDPDLNGDFTSSGYNLIGDAGVRPDWSTAPTATRSGAAGSPIDPMLGPLGGNGGPTSTHALLIGSPAIDAGLSGGLLVDQRGLVRTYDDAAVANAAGGNGTDIGAVELRRRSRSSAAAFRFPTTTSRPACRTRPISGRVQQIGPGLVRTFTVTNDGTSTLTLGSVALPPGYALQNTPPTELAPGASGTIEVALDISTPGFKAGQISFATNDPDEQPFNFSIAGMVNDAPELTDELLFDFLPVDVPDAQNTGIPIGYFLYGVSDVNPGAWAASPSRPSTRPRGRFSSQPTAAAIGSTSAPSATPAPSCWPTMGTRASASGPISG